MKNVEMTVEGDTLIIKFGESDEEEKIYFELLFNNYFCLLRWIKL